MELMKRWMTFILGWLIGVSAFVTFAIEKRFPIVSEQDKGQWFALFQQRQAASLWTDGQDAKVVSIAAELLADDVERVGKVRPLVHQAQKLKELKGNHVVIIGTVGQSRLIDALVKSGKLDVRNIRGKWESFVVTTLQRPFKGVEQALVLAGSDRRGTAFAALSLSEAIGVSPWYWWADVNSQPRTSAFVEPGVFVQGEPSVKYRGFFINDERFGGWARWAEEKFETETHQVGPKTYQKVFELLLRLKGNYLWPAMHPGTLPFNFNAENARLADDYAIVMGTSHCEQMLRNNEGEWKAVGTYGDFNYITNRKTMLRYWEERIQTNGRYENTYTLGLRGVHDYPMEGANTNEERVRLMQQAMNDQRDILQRNIQQPIEEIPQVLCTYEEVLDAYHSGLQVPVDVTLLWSDDKQGYLRNLCNPEERKRKGGAGVYYHLSYHGDPDSWFWLSPLSPALVSSEMTKAYEYGADKIWVFNVGDIKPAEKELSFAMELAWDVKRWTPERAHEFTKDWIERTLPVNPEQAEQLTALQNQYYRLMAYGKEFHTRWLDYSEQEITKRLQDWNRLSAAVENLANHVPSYQRASFFELFVYPIRGAALMNRYVLTARMSRAQASEGKASCLDYSRMALAAKDSLDQLTHYYNDTLLGGKWSHFFNWHPNWYLDGKREVMQVADAALLSKVTSSPTPQRLFHQREGYRGEKMQFSFVSDKPGTLPLWVRARTHINHNSFEAADNVFCQVSANGSSFSGSAQPHGNIWHTEMIGPLWSELGEIPIVFGKNLLTIAHIDSLATLYDVFLGIQPPFDAEALKRIKASEYSQSHQGRQGSLTTLPMLGYVDGVTIIPYLTDSYELTDLAEAPWVKYEVEVGSEGGELEIRTLPTLRVYAGRQARYAVSIDGHQPQVFSIHEGDYTSEWRWNVLRGYTRRFLPLKPNASGWHTVQIYLMDPGIVLEEICIHQQGQ